MTVLAVAEHRRGSLREVSYEVITAAKELADAADDPLELAVIGGDVEDFAESCNRTGVDVIHTAAVGEEFNHGAYTQILETLGRDLDARVIVTPHSVNGLDYAPAVANGLERPIVTDVLDIEVTGESLVATREMYSSKVRTTVEMDLPGVVTVRTGEWPPADGLGDATVRPVDVALDDRSIRSTVTGYEEVAAGDVDIAQADVLVSIGRGIGEEEHLDLIFELAEALGATVASSRPIVDSGWLPKNRQVGQSGKTVTPDVYIAIGISGAVQHVAGMKGAETIIAINTDPDAPIFDIADYGIVGDLFEVVPPLTEAFS